MRPIIGLVGVYVANSSKNLHVYVLWKNLNALVGGEEECFEVALKVERYNNFVFDDSRQEKECSRKFQVDGSTYPVTKAN